MNIEKQTRRQRALDLRAFLARNKHQFTLEQVCEHAGYNYNSVKQAISTLINHNLNAISDERLNKLHAAAIELEEQAASSTLSKTG